MLKVWHDAAWDEYLHWQGQDRKTLRRINALLREIDREPFSGLGKPEPLSGNLQGYWSRRIDGSNRIVYRIEQDQLIILQCGGHYGDK
ncbi:MAG: Txe/YoeB family addiction module toxin [Symbiobacteriaceae bacterium]|nr:Txe/YoeB family addiction module toxin [Symbiobacteriaceae bacterium]